MIVNEDLSYYIAGLWEGDGYIVAANSKTKYFTFVIMFNKNNIVLANFLKFYLGYGYIKYKTCENSLALTISNQKGLISIVKLLNGKLRTPKICKFNILIDWLNLQDPALNLVKYDINISNLTANYWFTGFCEACGYFDIRTSSFKQKSDIVFRLRIEQRMLNPITKLSYYDILSLISGVFLTKLKKIDRKYNSYYYICCINKNSIEKLNLYFFKFNLLGIKFLDFNLWIKAYILYKNRIKITPNLIEDLKKYKYQMNSRRTSFFLSHFNK